MILTKLKQVKKTYPTFLDKSSNSNFTKHLETLNSEQLDLYQTLHKLELNKYLNRPITIKKVQNAAYNFTLNFNVTLEHIKKVTIYKEGTEVYSETYTSENINNFNYTLEDTSVDIIPTEKYMIDVVTFDEYHFQKGYPENDVSNNTCYDHDLILDVMGNLLNVNRHNFILVDESDYANTLPPYHNKLTEDDYYYMERIKHYIQEYNHTYFPILEIWKYYNMTTGLSNRYHIISTQNDSYMSPVIYRSGDFPINYDYNKIKDSYFNVEVKGTFKIPYDIQVSPTTKYYFQIKINKANSPICVKIYYYDNEGDAIHVTEKACIKTNKDLIYYFMDDSPVNSSTVKIVLSCEESFNFSDMRFMKIGALNTGDDDAKYMRTKTDYNSCVYDVYGNYDDVPANLPLPTGDEVLSVIQRSLPITKKGFFNLLYHKKSQDQNLLLSEKLGIKFDDNLDMFNVIDTFDFSKYYIAITLAADNFYNLLGFTNSDDLLSSSEIGSTAISKILKNNIEYVESDAKNIKFQIRNLTDVLFETEDSNFTISSNIDFKNAYLKIISTTTNSSISYIHLYSTKELEQSDFGETTLIEEVTTGTDDVKTLTIHDGWNQELIPILRAENVACDGTCTLAGDYLSFNNNVTLFKDNPLNVEASKVYTFNVHMITNPDKIKLQVIELDSNGEVNQTNNSDVLLNNSETDFYYRFSTTANTAKIYFKILTLKTGVDYTVGDISCVYEDATQYTVTDTYKNYDAIKIDSLTNNLYKISTGTDNMFKVIRIHERLPVIIPITECLKELKISGIQNYKIVGVKYEE